MSCSNIQVVRILQEATDFVSGEEIARSLGVSRASVWKRIKHLRNSGFVVSASTNRGYRLVSVPDIPSVEVLSSLLNTDFFGRRIEYHQIISSTNDRAMELAAAGAESGTVVTADKQSAGKARFGGVWPSPPGKNLYLSLIVRPEADLSRAAEVADTALTSLQATVNHFAPDLPLCMKNCGLFHKNGKKIGGVLCEVYGEIQMIHWMSVGIGLNVSHCDSASGTESLFSLTGIIPSRAELTAVVLEKFERRYLQMGKI